MALFRLSTRAQEDIESILVWTHSQFGEKIRLRYEELLVVSILDLVENPTRFGSLERPEVGQGIFTYHLRYSRDHVERLPRIHKPRHFLVYRLSEDQCLEIGRILHDSMDIVRNLPPDYWSEEVDPQE